MSTAGVGEIFNPIMRLGGCVGSNQDLAEKVPIEVIRCSVVRMTAEEGWSRSKNQVDERLPCRDLCGEETTRFININCVGNLERTAWGRRDPSPATVD